MLRCAILMSIMRHAPSVPTSSELQAEASHVERLRRQIAEMPAKGESVSPQMLAEFARAQKSYLDRKIEFEKLKLNDSGAVKIPSALREAPAVPADPGIPIPAKFAAPLPIPVPAPAEVAAEKPQPAKVPVPPLSSEGKPAKSPMIWVIGVIVVAVIAAAAIFALR
jgi:hypothetical protein